jgi:hypothetical protein
MRRNLILDIGCDYHRARCNHQQHLSRTLAAIGTGDYNKLALKARKFD